MKKKINYGIKICTNSLNLLPKIYNNLDYIDFIEITLKRDFNYEKIKKIKNIKIPYAIHLPTSNEGIDFGNSKQDTENIKFISKLENYHKSLCKLNPLCYIIHPESCDKNHSLKNLLKLKLTPLAIENMPFKGINGEKMIGYNVEDLSYFFKKISDLQLCFDINHAIKAAISLKKQIFPFLNNFLKFKNPIIFHIADGNIDEEYDNHLSINKGDYDIKAIKNMLKKLNYIVNLTFETPRNSKENIIEYIENILNFQRI